MPNFEVFRSRGASITRDPYVTVQKSGALALSRPAFELMGEPTHVELLYDRDERMVGVRGVSGEEEHAYPVRNTATNPNQYLISGVAFLKFFGLEVKESRRFTAYLAGGVLCVDLKAGGRKVVGNRNGHKNPSPTPTTQASG